MKKGFKGFREKLSREKATASYLFLNNFQKVDFGFESPFLPSFFGGHFSMVFLTGFMELLLLLHGFLV